MAEWEYCTVTQEMAADGSLKGHGRLAFDARGGHRLKADARGVATALSLEGWELVKAEPARGAPHGHATEVVFTFRRSRSRR